MPTSLSTTERLPRIAAFALGALFFLSLAGWTLVSPVETDWTMKSDWRIHFLGWHIFRGEAWAWPPGRLVGYYHAPDGTSIGYTDSLPLVALALKPLSPWLPMPFQYLGLWLTACFALQGYWGARLAQLWTPNRVAQVLAGAVFVLTPTLLNRATHPALSAHWTLLWALHLYFRWRAGHGMPLGSMLLLGAVVGLVHPYLAVMTLALLTALAMRVAVERRATEGWWRASWPPTAALAATAGMVVAGWFVSGLFVVPGAAMARPGLTSFSMNLLAPITPTGWSAWMPEIPTGAIGQTFEGFQYLGMGLLVLILLAIARALTGPRPPTGREVSWPLVGICVLLAVYALSPRVTLADKVVFDFSWPPPDRLAVFGVTGRFFWPATYALLAWSARVVLTRTPSRLAAALLAVVIGVQVIDLRPAYASRVAATRSTAFHEWAGAPRSPVWAAALPHYRHLVVYPSAHCGPAPVTFELPGYLAGLYHLTMNDGESARISLPARDRYCADLARDLAEGRVDDQSVYLIHPAEEPGFRAAAPSLVCGTVDLIRACVTRRSYDAWRDAADFH